MRSATRIVLMVGPRPPAGESKFAICCASIRFNFAGPSGFTYTIWTSTDVTLSPISTKWTRLATGTFSGGADSIVDPSGGSNPQQFYVITSP